MSVAGLRYGAGQANGYAETKSGSFIYHGDAASYHDWEFRTLLRVELLEAQEVALRKAAAERRVETPSKETVEEEEIPTTDAPPHTPPRPGTSTTESRFFKDPEVEISKERYTLVAKIMEGLRGNAFLVARDMGTAALVQDEGLRSLISKIKLSVFPRASEEAKELFRLGQMRGGVLSRQMNESMVSYVDRRRRWWRMTSELDPTTQISESMRSELMIELSGISQQESLVVKSISGMPLTFEKVAETLISHYGSVHLRGSKTLTSATSSASAMHTGGKGKGKGKPGKTYWRTGFYGDHDEDGEWFPEYSQQSEYEYPDECYEEGQFAGLFANEHHEEEHQPDYPEEEVEEWEATVLNAVSQIGESTEGLDMPSVGEALQLELAALTAYGKSKGKKGKGKGKGKGKLVKSNLTLQQRRDKLQEIKAKSRCLRCGGIGHWAGDPSCKFPGSKQASQPGQSNPNTRTAMMAIHSDSSSSDGEAVNLGAGHPDAHTAMMAYATQSKAKAKAKAGPILPVREERALAERAAKAKASSSSSGYRGEVAIAPLPKPKSKSAPRRTPPNPPLAKCAECRDFNFRGSTAYTIKKTCVVCGNSETTRREENYIYTFENCPHEEVDHRGSSKSTSRVFCKQCGNFIHEEDIAVRKHRLEVSKRVEEAPEPVLEVASHVTDPRSSAYKYPSEEIQSILNLLGQNLSDQGDLTVADLHGELAQAIDMHNALMDQDQMQMGVDSDDPDGYPGWDPVPNAYMAVSTDQATGVVMLDLPVRDIMDPNDPNIYAALDEGCNSTCHSSKWGEMCNQKLKRFGVEFKWMESSSNPSFVGIGDKTKTLGMRAMPFGFLAHGDHVVKGKLESYEIDNGSTPMLLSLYAQCTLGMIKDLEHGKVSVKIGQTRREIPLYKCKKSGLLLVNLTEGLFHLDESKAPNSKLGDEHKFLRQFRMPASIPTCLSGSKAMDYTETIEALRGSTSSDLEDHPEKVLILTGGSNSDPQIDDKELLILECFDCYDPASSHLCAHIGRHQAIIAGLIQNCCDQVMTKMRAAADHVQRYGPMAAVMFKCKSNRHRSVALGTMFAWYLHLEDVEFHLHHLEAHRAWTSMRCGGRCEDCYQGTIGNLLSLNSLLYDVMRMMEVDESRLVAPFAAVTPCSGTIPAIRGSASRSAPMPKTPPGPPPDHEFRKLQKSLEDLTKVAKAQQTQLDELKKVREDTRRSRSRSPPRRRRRHPSRSDSRGRAPHRRAPQRPPSPPSPPRRTSVGLMGDRPVGGQSEQWGVYQPLHHHDERASYTERFQATEVSSQQLDGILDASDHDRLTWIGPGEREDNHYENVRVQTKRRGNFQTTHMKVPGPLKGWKKTTFLRTKGVNQWRLIEHEVNAVHGSPVARGSSELVIFLQKGIDHRASSRYKERQPPDPPVSRRLVLKSRKLVYDGDLDDNRDKSNGVDNMSMDERTLKKVAPKTEPTLHEEPWPHGSLSHACGATTKEAMDLDPDESSSESEGSEQVSYQVESTKVELHDMSDTVDLHNHVMAEPVCHMAFLSKPSSSKGDSNEKMTTMSKKRKNEVIQCVDDMNFHDRLLRFSFGLQESPSVTNHTVVFTSHPMLFQLDGIRTIDVGWGAEHVDEAQVGSEVWETLEGASFIVFAVKYDHDSVALGHNALNHAKLLTEVQTYCDATGVTWINFDAIDTMRWNHFAVSDPPTYCSMEVGMTTNNDKMEEMMVTWFDGIYLDEHDGKSMDDLFSHDFASFVQEIGQELHLESMSRAAFPAEMVEESSKEGTFDEVLTEADVGHMDPGEEILSDETFLDTVEVPGLPMQEQERRKAWRKLPQRVRISVRRLHRQFGHCPRNVMTNLLKAAKVDKAYIDAVKLHRCTACEDNAPKTKTHKTSLPYEYRFGANLGIDLLELKDSVGHKYAVLNMVDLGTTFQVLHVIRQGLNATSAQVLKALSQRWFSWAGFPETIVCDRGLHMRGVLASYCAANGIQVKHAPLETPEAIGRVERHGGIAKALYRKVAAEVQPTDVEQVDRILAEVAQVKNNSTRHGGFSPAQWVLGRSHKTQPSLLGEQWSDLGVLQEQADPESIFALQQMARVEARKAFVYLDTSKRVQRAMLKNASPISMKYEVGDVVCYRRDNNADGGVRWSVASRVIGHEGERDVWVLCRNVPVLVSVHNLRPANDAEALARSVLNGDPIVPSEIVEDGQKFIDARGPEKDPEIQLEQPPPEDDYEPSLAPSLPALEDLDAPPGQDASAGIPPNEPVPVEEDEEDGNQEAEESFGVIRPLATRRSAPAGFSRSVRARTETTAEGGSSVANTQPASPAGGSQESQESRPASTPAPWPSLRDSLDDLPLTLRRHFEAQRAAPYSRPGGESANVGIVEMPDAKSKELWSVQPMGTRKRFVTFMAQRFEEAVSQEEGEEEKRVDKTLSYEHESLEMRELINEARKAEWGKYIRYSAAVPLDKEEAERLIREGHTVIPSKWVDVDKNAHKAHEEGYQPKVKSRLVSCGNFEDQGSLRTDAPTSDMETHHIVVSWAASHGVKVHTSDVASAYFQATPLDRVVIMRQPRSGLPGVDPDTMLLIRVPVYGLCDSGRGFWKRLDSESKETGFTASAVFPAFYFFKNNSSQNEDEIQESEVVAVMTTHVDDLLYSYLPQGKQAVEKLLSKFDIGTQESQNFRYCGKSFDEVDSVIRINVSDNTRRIHPIRIQDGRPNHDELTPSDVTQLRSVVGSLSWIARQGRPDLLYVVSRLQSEVKGATVQTLRDANKAVALAQAGRDEVFLRFPMKLMKWNNVGVLSVSDASFANEPGRKSQQGRCHFLAPIDQLKNPEQTEFDVYPISFSSTTIKRVCRATLQCETYALQHSMESGDRIRALLVEMTGKIPERMRNWEDICREQCPQLSMSDCMSLVKHLNAPIMARCQDKRLEIEMKAIRQSLRDDQDKETYEKFVRGGDKLIWIHTSSMVADALTKRMKPDFLIGVLRTNRYRVDLVQRNKEK